MYLQVQTTKSKNILKGLNLYIRELITSYNFRLLVCLVILKLETSIKSIQFMILDQKPNLLI